MTVEDEKKVGLEADATPATTQASTVADPSAQVFDNRVDDEPTDPRDRSQLGRRVKRVEDSVNTLVSKLDTFVDRLGNPTQPYHQPYEEEEDEEFLRKMEKYERKKTERQSNYEKNYVSKVRQLGSGDQDYKEIFDEMYNNFNRIHSGDPDLDARLNWSDARASVLSKRLSPNKPNVRGERNTASTDLGINATNDSAASTEVQLDDFAKEFIARTGMKKESVERAVKSESRPGVSSKR